MNLNLRSWKVTMHKNYQGKRSPLSLLLSGLLISSTLVGCSGAESTRQSNTPASDTATPVTPEQTDSAATPTAEPNAEQPWVTILPGEAAYDLQFTSERALAYQDTVLLSDIPVSYSSDGSATYAERLIVSNSSPSGNYNFVKGCESSEPDTGLCWSVYLVDKAGGTANPTTVGKYGGREWVQWSEDERYAVLIEQMEGASWLYVVDLETGESRNLGEMSANVDLESFTWTGDRTFQIQVDSTAFEGDIDSAFAG